MNTMASLILFGGFVLVYGLVIEIFTVLFRLTGLTREKSRLQAVSLLTNSGFTTGESELVVATRQRRRLAQIAMLTGYSFAVVILSVAVNVFLSLSLATLEDMLLPLVTTGVLLIGLTLLARMPVLRDRFDTLIERLGNRIMFGKQANILVLVDIYRNKAMVEVVLETVPDFLENTPLAASGLRERDIHLLFLKRAGQPVEPIGGDTILQKEDSCLFFGNYKNILIVFGKGLGEK